MIQFESPFLAVPVSDWLCSNDLAFAIFDGFPVSPGHVLVTTRRIVETWFDASDEEQAALMALVKESKRLLDLRLDPKPDGYNVGFNSGGAAGQTVPHVHIHVIPRYQGDMPDPRGGVRHVIPDKGNYMVGKSAKSDMSPALTLTTGHPTSPLWKSINQRVSSAVEVDLLASFIQPSGLDLVQQSIFAALRAEARIRILVGDYLPRTLAARFGSWFGFISEQDDLTADERQVFASFESWLSMLEGTSLNKSYKMVVLRVLLDRDALWGGMEIEKLAAACREFLLSHPTLRHDLQPTQQFPDPAKAPIEEWAAWWLEWPLSRWMDEQAGRHWFKREGDRFLAAFPCPENLRPGFEAMTAELVDYRLAHYAKSRIEKAAELTAGRFVAKVSHSGGKPILRLPTVEELPGRPIGPTTATLPDGSQWVFKFVKIACNVASPLGSEENQILPLLRGWFGENAGAPGTNYQVAFTKSETGWSVEPVAVATPLRVLDSGAAPEEPPNRDLPGFVEAPAAKEKFTRLVPVYSLEAAAGLWGPESTPEEIGWAEAAGASIKPGMFIARVRGHSMEPKIKDGSWNLFRPCPAGDRKNRIVLVQFKSRGDLENGGRFTVKKYQSVKRVTEHDWSHEHIELLPLNRDYDPIIVTPHEAPEMVVVGEWVSSID